MQYVVDVTNARTSAQETSAYITDRRDQSYQATAGLGNLASSFRTASGALTTIGDVIPAGAYTGAYADKGNGIGTTTSSLGKVVDLVKTVRGSFSSTNPPKAAFNFPRPWRMDANSEVIVTGTETTGYYTSSNSAGDPDTTKTLTYFPEYDSPVSVAPSLMARRGTTASSDGGFPSGHTNAAYLASYALAYSVPERFDSLMLNASSMGEDRILAGMHSPLDVIGGRIQAVALSAAILRDAANATLKSEARVQAKTVFSAQLGSDSPVSQSQWVAGKQQFTERMTYNLPTMGATNIAASVPVGAEVLLETRFTYLDESQRREILKTTAIGSGHAGEDAEGWSRLNLYAASGGYGSFDQDVSIVLSSGKDYWRNDISGTGGLEKAGDGTLVLTGNNTYTGTTTVTAGTLVVVGEMSCSTIIGAGGILSGSGKIHDTLVSGTLAIGNSPGTMTFTGDLTLDATSVSNFEINGLVSGSYDLALAAQAGTQALIVNGGILNLLFTPDFNTLGDVTIFDFDDYQGIGFSQVNSSGLASGYSATFNQSSGVVTVIPEPHSVLLTCLGVMALFRRRRCE